MGGKGRPSRGSSGACRSRRAEEGKGYLHKNQRVSGKGSDDNGAVRRTERKWTSLRRHCPDVRCTVRQGPKCLPTPPPPVDSHWWEPSRPSVLRTVTGPTDGRGCLGRTPVETHYSRSPPPDDRQSRRPHPTPPSDHPPSLLHLKQNLSLFDSSTVSTIEPSTTTNPSPTQKTHPHNVRIPCPER